MTLQEMLDEAKAAYHALMTGQSVAEVRDQNGETIRYNRSDVTQLRAYIEDLKLQIAGTPIYTGPLRVVF